MALKANYEFLFVGKDENSFLENYAYEYSGDVGGDRGGQFFINFEVQGNPVDAEDMGKALYETMQQAFFENLDADPYERFEAALKASNGVLNDFKSQKSSGYIGSLNVVIAVVVSGVLYLTAVGDSEAYLIRKRYVSVISEGLDDESSDDVFNNIASGDIEPGDSVIFSSTRLLRYISQTDLAKACGSGVVTEALAEVQDIISTEILGRVGLTGIVFEEVADTELAEGEARVHVDEMEVSDGGRTVKRTTLFGQFVSGVKGAAGKIKRSRTSGKSKPVAGKRESRPTTGKAAGKSWFDGFMSGIKGEGFGKDKVLITLVGVIVVLLLAIFVVNSSSAEREEIDRLSGILEGVQEKILEAETKGTYDKETAKILLDGAYNDAMQVLNSEHLRDKARIALDQVDQIRDRLDGVERISEASILVDFAENYPDINALGFATVNDRVFVYTPQQLYEVVLDQIQDPITIDEEETVIAASGWDERDSVVFLTKSGRVLEFKDGTVAFMDTDDGEFRRGVDIATWSNRIYILDSASNQIWRYTYSGARERFGIGEDYIADGQDLDLNNAVSLAIDANVYLLKSNSEVNKVYGGQKAEFYIDNPPFNNVTDPKVIYTNEKLDRVFVLDGQDARVLVFIKDDQTGNIRYEEQIMFDEVGDLRDLWVDERIMYVLTQDKIIEHRF